MDDNKFSIKVGEFEGPLDLLLQLIEKKKLHISQVSVAQVADEYINHISGFNHLPKHEVADFLVIASTLMLIKSAALLPDLKLTSEEEQTADELEYRLKLYQHMQNVSEKIKPLYGRQPIYSSVGRRNPTPVFSPTAEITPGNLLSAMYNLLTSIPKPEIIPEVAVKKVISLAEVIERLTTRIQSALSMRFNEFAPVDKNERVNVIVSFLGMLELVKQGIIDVRQEKPFEDIDMNTAKPDIPRY